jgi:hypothetical protein
MLTGRPPGRECTRRASRLAALVGLVLLGGCSRSNVSAGLDPDCSDGARCREQARDLSMRNVKDKSPVQASRAIALYKKGCELGDRLSCAAAGSYLEDGELVPADLPSAARTYDQGCTLKDVVCCDRLAKLYRDGRGVPKDPSLASKYRQLACGLADRMTRETFCEGQEGAELPKPPSPPGPDSVGADSTPTLGNIGIIGKSPGAAYDGHHHRSRSPENQPPPP